MIPLFREMRPRSPDFQLTIMEWNGFACCAVRVDVLRAGKKNQLVWKCCTKHHHEKGCEYGQDKIWWSAFDWRKNIFVVRCFAHSLVTRSASSLRTRAVLGEEKQCFGRVLKRNLGTRPIGLRLTGRMAVGRTGSAPDRR